MKQMAVALRNAGVSRWRVRREPAPLQPASPAFAAMALVHEVADVASELRAWQSRSGHLWRLWRRLDAEAKVEMARMGRRFQEAVS